MNTPPSSKPKRYPPQPPKQDPRFAPDGEYADGIHDDEGARLLGKITSTWPLVEEQMITVFRILLGGDQKAPAREVFRSLTSERLRVDILTLVLEQSSINKNREELFDELISEFGSLRRSRNAYVHGLWVTHQTGKLFLAPPSLDGMHWLRQRNVSVGQLRHILKRMIDLIRRVIIVEIQERRQREHDARDPLPETPRPLVDGKALQARRGPP